MQEQHVPHTQTKIATLTLQVVSQIKVVITATTDVDYQCLCNVLEISLLTRGKQHDIVADKPQLFPTSLHAPTKERVLA